MTGVNKVLRCAIYTRKSTDEGLEQDFNSLQAQREACEAFIVSQRSEGWKLIATAYDDGGLSGGTMERPALQRLMADIEEKRIDVVVVYKVDRLTRSLSDFSKMVEVFDRHGVSFVAVTQQFNTTTSMGRLTLNVLLSFAQFEREVTAERIQDKIAASKRKGIWMGGGIPRGYRVENRKLVVVPEQARIVNHIYRRYLECSGIRELSLTLKRDGIVVASRKNVCGDDQDGQSALSRGALYSLLRNPIYVGLIPHKGELFPGQHQGIVNRPLWDAVQKKLAASRRCRGRPRRKTENSPLMGKLFDECGRLLTPTHANKNGRRYRYYISHSDHENDDYLHRKPRRGWRLPAREIEDQVSKTVAGVLDNPSELIAAETASTELAKLDHFLASARYVSMEERLQWVKRVDLTSECLKVVICPSDDTRFTITQDVPMLMKRRGVEQRIVLSAVQHQHSQPDPHIVKALSLGLRFWEQLMSLEKPLTAVQFANREGIDNRYVGRALRLAFLAPDIVERYVMGGQPIEWTSKRLLMWDETPFMWQVQVRAAGLNLAFTSTA